MESWPRFEHLLRIPTDGLGTCVARDTGLAAGFASRASRSILTAMKRLLRTREPFNGLSHLAGALVALLLAVEALMTLGGLKALSVAGMAFLLFALLVSSAAYHLVRGPEDFIARLRTLDHAMIFLFIAATYTPFCLGPLAGPWGNVTVLVVWVMACLGFGLRLVNPPSSRTLRTALYLIMGWMSLAIMPKLIPLLGFESLLGLVLGGAFYTVGAIIYMRKRPNPWPAIVGFHGLWHVCVLLAAFSHLYSVWHLTDF